MNTMHANVFDRYHEGHSPIHRLDPRVKVVLTLLFVLSNVVLPDDAWLAYALSWGLVLLISMMADLGAGYALRRSFIALPFALAAVTVLVNVPGQPLAAWAFGPWALTVTDAGLERFVSIVVRSWLSVQMAILLTATTQFPDLMHALRHLRVPTLIIAIVSFMYRYLFVLSDEVLRLLRARESRSARPAGSGGGGTLAWRARVAGNMAGQLFLRSYERSDRVFSAMLARGYDGQLLTLNPHAMRRTDWAVAIGTTLVLLVVQLVGRVGFGL